MDSEVIGRAVFVIEADFGDARQQVQDFQRDFQASASSAEKNAVNLDSGLANFTLGVNNLKQAFSLLSGGMSVIGDLTDSYNRYEASMNGVSAVARATGQSVAESLQVVKDVSADGLISQYHLIFRLSLSVEVRLYSVMSAIRKTKTCSQNRRITIKSIDKIEHVCYND